VLAEVSLRQTIDDRGQQGLVLVGQ
jgi:hypothetical protein